MRTAGTHVSARPPDLGPRPSRAALLGLSVGTGLAIVGAMGPLTSATTITIGVETQVGHASGLPDALMLPAALEGVGVVALVYLVTRRPTGGLRAWCAALILVSLGAGMAAQGAHAVWYDEATHQLELPWNVRLLVSFVPPVSGLATLHLVVKMVEDLVATIRQLLTIPSATEPMSDVAPDQPTAPRVTGVDGRVLRMVRANPRMTWRVVKARTGLTDANAKRALTAARKTIRVLPTEPIVDDARRSANGSTNGRARE